MERISARNMKNDMNVTLSLEELSALLAMNNKQEDPMDEEERAEVREDAESFKEFFRSVMSAFFKYWWLLLVVTILFGVVTSVFVSMQPQEYTATVQMYARNRSANTSTTELNLQEIANAEYYITLYGEYLKMDMPLQSMLDSLNEAHDGKYSAMTVQELYDMISIGSLNKTPLLYVSVTDTDPQRAVDIANVIREELPGQLKDLSGLEESPVRPIDWPETSADAKAVSAHVIRKAMIAAVIGFLLSCIFVCVKGCLLDDSIESPSWLTENFKTIPLLAEIPDIKQMSQKNGAEAERKG